MITPPSDSIVMTRKVTVEWGQCDPLGIIFYPTYFLYFDQSSHQLFAMVGHDMRSLRSEFGLAGPVIVDARARFMRPVTYGDDLSARAFVSEWRSKIFAVAHQFFHGDTMVCEGHEIRAWALPDKSSDTGIAAAPIPDSFRKLFLT